MIDSLEIIKGEDRYAVELMRKAFPSVPPDNLKPFTIRIRTEKYATGRWPTTAELKSTYDVYLGAFETLPAWHAGVPLADALNSARGKL